MYCISKIVNVSSFITRQRPLPFLMMVNPKQLNRPYDQPAAKFAGFQIKT